MLKVLVIGSGGREHALVKACLNSPLVSEVVALPGNGGIKQDAKCYNIDPSDKEAVRDLVDQGIDFVIIGPEVPLCEGLADEIRAIGIPVFGPGAAGAKLEGSKDFSKRFMLKHGVPTAASETFTDAAKAQEYIQARPSGRVVIKASGLAAGKGVIIANNKTEASAAAHAMLDQGNFGDSGKTILVEDFLEGEEASITVIVSGKDYVILPTSQDHKRAGEGDTGLNTGGMGAYAPAACVTPELMAHVDETIVKPSVEGLIHDGIDFRGTLYIGIMITEDGPKVLEYNVRFGDPETQVLLPLLETDPIQLLFSCAEGSLCADEIKIKDAYAMVVVLAAKGYPQEYGKGDKITFTGKDTDDSYIVHAGTRRDKSGNILTNGGRVLGAVGCGASLQDAADKAYAAADNVDYSSKMLRRDIGYRQLNREKETV